MKRADLSPSRSRPLGIWIDVDLSALRTEPARQDAPGGSLDIPVTFEDDPAHVASAGQRGANAKRDTDASLEVPVTFDFAAGAEEDLLAPSVCRADPPESGDVIAARYRVLRRLGTGGMGVVYACSHAFLDRTIALKVVRRDTDEDALVAERLFREARLAAQVQSPHVVQVLDCGRLPDGSPYVAMEFIEGLDLLTLVRQNGPLPAGRVIDYMLQACHGLAAAHRHQIVHRDLKLENLIVTTSPEGAECIKIIDFGISTQLLPGKHRPATDPRSSVGSPHAMSPEQIATPERVDARTDLWSLGVVMYELLVGSPPFGGTGPYEVCLNVLVSPAPDPRLARPDVPDALAEIVLCCLEKHPARRFRSADALATALRAARERAHGGDLGASTAEDSPPSAAEGSRSTKGTRHSGSWLRALAPMLSAITALLIGFPAHAEPPCRLQTTRPSPHVEELRIPHSPRLAPLRGVRLSSLSVWGVPLALGVDSRASGAIVLLRFGGGTREDLKIAEEHRDARELTRSEDERAPADAPIMVLSRLAAASRAIRRCR